MKTIQLNCIKSPVIHRIIPKRIVLNQSVFTLIHIIGIFLVEKLQKYYISCETVNFLKPQNKQLC